MAIILDPRSSPNIDCWIEVQSVTMSSGNNKTVTFEAPFSESPFVSVLPNSNNTVGYDDSTLDSDSVDITTGATSDTDVLVIIIGK